MKRILFLCSGNYYRSRFAEIFFNWHAQVRGMPWRAESRGLAINPCNLGPISCHAKSNLAARGIWCDSVDRLPLAVTDDDFAAAHHVVAVKEPEHRPLVESSFPRWHERVEYWHVHDVDCAMPEEALPILEREVLGLIERLIPTSVN